MVADAVTSVLVLAEHAFPGDVTAAEGIAHVAALPLLLWRSGVLTGSFYTLFVPVHRWHPLFLPAPDSPAESTVMLRDNPYFHDIFASTTC